MSPSRKRKTCSADENDELMAEFRRLRDETQPIRDGIAALSPFQTPRGDPPNEQLGSLLRELQLMRTEIRQSQNEMKENLEQIRKEMAEVKNNQEELKNAVTENTTTLESLKTKIESETAQMGTMRTEIRTEMIQIQNKQKDNMGQIRKEVAEVKKELKANQDVLMENITYNACNLNIVKTKVESVIVQINVINEKVSKLKCRPTFREQISGKWKIDNAHKSIILSLKLDDNQLILQWDSDEPYVYALDVLDSEGEKVELKGEKIVHSCEDFRIEYYLEDGKLKIVDKKSGNPARELTFKRIGDPDPK